MPSRSKPVVHTQPLVDEWGFYDPDQAGLAAVFQRLTDRGSAAAPVDAAAEVAACTRDAQELTDRK